MMEWNTTLDATITQEVMDLRDIATGGNTSLDALLGCVVNTRASLTPGPTRMAFEKHLPAAMPLTMAGLDGEWAYFNNSISCVASNTAPRPLSYGRAVGRRAASMVMVSSRGASVAQAVTDLQGVLRKASELSENSARISVVDCLVFVPQIQAASDVRAAVYGTMPYGPRPAVTLIEAKLAQGDVVSLQCTAMLTPSAAVVAAGQSDGYGVKANGLLFADGIQGKVVPASLA